jgi:HemY protein
MVLESWAPVSPVTGKLDAVEWKLPLAEIEGPRIEVAAADLRPPALVRTESAPAAEAEGVARSRALAATTGGAVAHDRPSVSSPRPAPPISPSDGTAEPVIEPPRPDDPGVGSTDEEEGSRQAGSR